MKKKVTFVKIGFELFCGLRDFCDPDSNHITVCPSDWRLENNITLGCTWMHME